MGCGYSLDHYQMRNKSSVCFGKDDPHLNCMSETSLEAKVLSRASKAQKSTKNDSIIDESHFFYDEIIGVGGFGLVRLAVKVEAGADSEPEDLNLYAIKSIPKRNVLAKKNGVLSVYNELRCLTALTDKSPFINKLHHAFHDRRYVYLVLQFCPGGDMRLALRRQPFGVFPENIARFYAAQLIRKCHDLRTVALQ
jgi:hypothetical protein